MATANVHHRERARNGGGYTEENLITFCKSCHDDEHYEERVERASGGQTPARTTVGETKEYRERMAKLHSMDGESSEGILRPADEEILDVLAEGRNNAPNIADESGLSKQYIRERLGRLRDEEFVETIGSGIYELVNDPREEP